MPSAVGQSPRIITANAGEAYASPLVHTPIAGDLPRHNRVVGALHAVIMVIVSGTFKNLATWARVG